jgi:hypothetical protein
MKNKIRKITPRLFDRVAAILEEARASVVRTVNTSMVIAYWHIGCEIVQEDQGGKRRAGYGDTLLEDLSRRLAERYGRGYSVANLKNFRQFYLTYEGRLPQIRYSSSSESGDQEPERQEPGDDNKGQFARRRLANSRPDPSLLHGGFAAQLSWSHYSPPATARHYPAKRTWSNSSGGIGIWWCGSRGKSMGKG